jgi:sulfate transport system permease protein
MAEKKFNPLPGFGLTMGYTLLYLSALVLIPIAGLFLKAFQLSWSDFWRLTTDARALAAYKLTFGASLIAALVNAVFGTLLAWVLARYQFFGRRFIDALVDFPFALPTAVAGLTLSNLFVANGWLGRFLVPWGIKGAFTPLAVVIALTFVGLPFVVRTLQPVLANLEQEVEEVAATLGAGRMRTFFQIIAPTLLPTVLTGFALAFARAVGEYGSIVFVSGNMPFKTEIAPFLIVVRLEQYDYLGATAIAAVLLVISLVILAIINWLEVWAGRLNK